MEQGEVEKIVRKAERTNRAYHRQCNRGGAKETNANKGQHGKDRRGRLDCMTVPVDPTREKKS